MEEQYNGWSNRETWATALHINNDEGLIDQINEYAKSVLEYGEEYPASIVAVRLEEWVSEIVSEEHWAYEIGSNMPKGAKMMRDDIGSLWRINWYEIAESFLSDVAVS
jgi:hypothetical protein